MNIDRFNNLKAKPGIRDFLFQMRYLSLSQTSPTGTSYNAVTAWETPGICRISDSWIGSSVEPNHLNPIFKVIRPFLIHKILH